jgi:hypothetical protein
LEDFEYIDAGTGVKADTDTDTKAADKSPIF